MNLPQHHLVLLLRIHTLLLSIQQVLTPSIAHLPSQGSPTIEVMLSKIQPLPLSSSGTSDTEVPPTCVSTSQPPIPIMQPIHPMTICCKSGIVKPRQVLDLHDIIKFSSKTNEPTIIT